MRATLAGTTTRSDGFTQMRGMGPSTAVANLPAAPSGAVWRVALTTWLGADMIEA